MNDNYLMLDGKKIPMNEETEQLLRGQYKKRHVPVVRVASYETGSLHDRVIIRLFKPAKELFKNVESDVVVIDEYGCGVNNWSAICESVNGMPEVIYSNIQTLIEGNLT